MQGPVLLPSMGANADVGLPGIAGFVLGTPYQAPSQDVFFSVGEFGIQIFAGAPIEQARAELEIAGLKATIVAGALRIEAADFEDFEIAVEEEFEADLAAVGFVPTLVEAVRQPTGVFAELYLTKQTMLLIGSSYPTGAMVESSLIEIWQPFDLTGPFYLEFTVSVDQADPITLRVDEAAILAAGGYNPSQISLVEISNVLQGILAQSPAAGQFYPFTRGGEKGRFVLSGTEAGSDHSVHLQNFVDTAGTGLAFPDTFMWGKDRLSADQRFYEAESAMREMKDRLEAAGIP